jgi:hypothetical protein
MQTCQPLEIALPKNAQFSAPKRTICAQRPESSTHYSGRADSAFWEQNGITDLGIELPSVMDTGPVSPGPSPAMRQRGPLTVPLVAQAHSLGG